MLQLLSSMFFKHEPGFLCLLLWRKVVISSLRSQKRSSALPLDSHLYEGAKGLRTITVEFVVVYSDCICVSVNV